MIHQAQGSESISFYFKSQQKSVIRQYGTFFIQQTLGQKRYPINNMRRGFVGVKSEHNTTLAFSAIVYKKSQRTAVHPLIITLIEQN